MYWVYAQKGFLFDRDTEDTSFRCLCVMRSSLQFIAVLSSRIGKL